MKYTARFLAKLTIIELVDSINKDGPDIHIVRTLQIA